MTRKKTTTRKQDEGDKVFPQGRDQIPAALIAATERLCSTRPPSSVSVRDIASEARVTTGLIHHYFESKDALVAATMRSISEDIGQTSEANLLGSGDVSEAVRAVWRFGIIRPAFMMIAFDWLLEGRNPTEAMGSHPYVQSLAKALGAPEREAAYDEAAVLSLFSLAGNVLHPGFSRAVGREPGDTRLIDAAEDALVELAQSAQARAKTETD